MDGVTKRLTENLPDRYEIVREHGRGGMAVVYLALDRKHGREVALKVLSPELTAGSGGKRFLREIQIAAHLSHPHIVPLLDSGLAQGLPYYVMPFVEGETLRERLVREKFLPLEEALRIATDVGEALEYAHEHDVIHRDIKPGNILLTGRGAVVTDFGVAAALDRLPDDHMTRTGVSVGTAGYMSPEQASGERDIDGRADQYALATVLYEMLAGQMPFPGPNARAVLSRQLTESPPAVSTHAPSIPAEVDELLARALAREPSDRFATSAEFASALEGAAHRAATGEVLRFRTRPVVWGALATAVMVAGLAWLAPDRGLFGRAEVQIDTARYAVFPFAKGEIEFPVERLLGNALSNWEGLSTVDDPQLRERMGQLGVDSLGIEQVASIARSVRAGRFLVGDITALSDSLLVTTRLYQVDPDGSRRIGEKSVQVARTEISDPSIFMPHIVQLLWPEGPPGPPRANVGTNHAVARTAFEAGLQDLEVWDLVEAETAFERATEWDSEYAEAHLWTALARMWQGKETGSWLLSARLAADRSEALSRRDSLMAAAVILQAEDDLGPACQAWTNLADVYPDDYAPWFGLGRCLLLDSAVVRDSYSPSGWSFRSSRNRAIEAYDQAVLKHTPVLESFRANAFESLRSLINVSGSTARRGLSMSADGKVFLAWPSWFGDSLAYVPLPLPDAFSATEEQRRRRRVAVQHLRTQFRQLVVGWSEYSPRSAAAKEALAVALSLDGDPAAIDTLRRGRSLAGDPEEANRMAALEVWLLVAFGMPSDESKLDRARSLADSVLAADSLHSMRESSSLAALTGRAFEAADTWRTTGCRRDDVDRVPGELADDACALLLFASMGGPDDSLAVREDRLMRGLEAYAGSEEQADAYGWLAMPASMLARTHPLKSMSLLSADWVIAAQLAGMRGDTASVIEALESQSRAGVLPYTISLDALFAEAGLWVAAGSVDEAARWVDPSLLVLPRMEPQLQWPYRLAALVRLAGLRAEIARAAGDHRLAASWANAVTILWSDADPFLQPYVEQMQALAECNAC